MKLSTGGSGSSATPALRCLEQGLLGAVPDLLRTLRGARDAVACGDSLDLDGMA